MQMEATEAMTTEHCQFCSWGSTDRSPRVRLLGHLPSLLGWGGGGKRLVAHFAFQVSKSPDAVCSRRGAAWPCSQHSGGSPLLSLSWPSGMGQGHLSITAGGSLRPAGGAEPRRGKGGGGKEEKDQRKRPGPKVTSVAKISISHPAVPRASPLPSHLPGPSGG